MSNKTHFSSRQISIFPMDNCPFFHNLYKKIDLRQKPQVVTAYPAMHRNCATKGNVTTEKMVETKTYSEARFSSLP